MLTDTTKLARGGATFLEEYAAWAPDVSPRSFDEENRPEVEVREVGLSACTAGDRGVKKF